MRASLAQEEICSSVLPPPSVSRLAVPACWSKLVFKSYEEGWQAFESDSVHVVHFDEEPEQRIYAGGLMRTITVDGVVYITVTPLQGLTELQQAFM